MKSAIVAAWRKELSERLAAAESGQQTARSGTRVDGSHRPANRGERGAVTAQGYLALGLGQRAAEISEHLRLLDEVGTGARQHMVVGAVVRLQKEGSEAQTVAVLPGGDATWLKVRHGGDTLTPVQILSADSPLIRQLRECETGDAEEVTLGRRIVVIEVLQIT